VGDRTVYFEMVAIGGAVRVAAVDSLTGVEAVVTGPVNAARSDLEALALRKLERLLSERPAAPPPRPGKLV
jgi:hypothetical protein